MPLHIISAGAGSGKTYTLTQKLTELLRPDPETGCPAISASGIFATTFTNKAAAELRERVRVKLLQEGLSDEAEAVANAMIGTVHSLGTRLLKRFPFEAGMSPKVDIMGDNDGAAMFNSALAIVLDEARTERMAQLSEQLSYGKLVPPKDWRDDVRALTEIARANNFGKKEMEASKRYSIQTLEELLPEPEGGDAEESYTRLRVVLAETIDLLNSNSDTTKGKTDLLKRLRSIHTDLKGRGSLCWAEWAELSKLSPTAKSKEDVAPLIEFASSHVLLPNFRADLFAFIEGVYDLAWAAMDEYDQYKRTRGLIDYTDMEVALLGLLQQSTVREELQNELDLLLVDEFQDTNPIQLQIFLELTKLAKQAIWVGDPKQSIYGFRGAAPELMQAVINRADSRQILEQSWRSRPDLVNSVNGIFCSGAFAEMDPATVALKVPEKFQQEDIRLKPGIIHWHFRPEEGKSNKEWLSPCTAEAIKQLLEDGSFLVRKKGSTELMNVKPADIAVLCRSNKECLEMAGALNSVGLRASISQNGLLETSEVKMLFSCMRFVLNRADSLAVAEILLLAERQELTDIIDNRLEFLAKREQGEQTGSWGFGSPLILELNKLRDKQKELSGTEMLNLLLDQLDLRRIISSWGNAPQRLANIDALCGMAFDYEEACHRTHTAATLGGLLLWLGQMSARNLDLQGKPANDNAITVITYHRSKGLEWPIVVCAALETKLREDNYGFQMVNTLGTVNLERPLDGRLARFWPNPYAKQNGKTDLDEAIKASAAAEQAAQSEYEEAARLMYVGLTRARDYIVLPTRDGGNTVWLNATFHGRERSLLPALDPDTDECFWTWEGKSLAKLTQIFTFPKKFEQTDIAEPETISYLATRSGAMEHKALSVTATKDDGALPFKVGIKVAYTQAIGLPDGMDSAYYYGLLHDWLCRTSNSVPELETMLRDSATDVSIAPQILKHQALFSEVLQSLVPTATKTTFRQWFKGRLSDGRLLDTHVDMVMDTPNGWVLLAHHAEAIPNRLDGRVQELGRTLAAAAQLLATQSPKPVTKVLVHFPLCNVVWELKL